MHKLTPEQEKGQHGGAPETMQVRYKSSDSTDPVVINADSFDEELHERVDEAEAETKSKRKSK